MRCRSKRLSLLLAFLLFAASSTRAQNDAFSADSTAYQTESTEAAAEIESTAGPIASNEKAPTDAQWQQATSAKPYAYKNELEYDPKKDKPQEVPKTPWLIRVLIAFFHFLGTTTGHIILWSLLAIIVGYVLYRILAGEGRIFARKNRKHTGEEEPAEITEEDLLESNWEERLRAALQSGDARMAVRYSYMRLLQILQSRDLIQYRPDKTNAAYFGELSGHAIRQDFRKLTRQYEYTWYGSYLPSADGLNDYLSVFNGVKKQLGAS